MKMNFIFIITRSVSLTSFRFCFLLLEYRAMIGNMTAPTSKGSNLRWGLAFLWAIIVFPVSYIIFNIAFVLWAEKTYPHANSMAGFAAFVYGFPAGLMASLATFLVVLATTKYKDTEAGRK